MKNIILVFVLLIFSGANHGSEQTNNYKVFIEFKDLNKIKAYQILDVRDKRKFLDAHLPNSIWIDVSSFDVRNSSIPSMIGDPGDILDKLRKKGVRDDKRVLIVGETIRSFGEDGRLFWILNQFTDLEVQILNGGFSAIQSFDKKIKDLDKSTPTSVRIDDQIPLVQLKKTIQLFKFEDLHREDILKIDVRTLPEFMGATPFGSRRGGHIPEAIWLPWHSFFHDDGRVKKRPTPGILEKLGNKQPVLYCTAGYRSALVYAALLNWGLDPINYDGSWYEYAVRTSNSSSESDQDQR